MDCNIISEEIISIKSYLDSEITFSLPEGLMPRMITESDYVILSGGGTDILFNEDDRPTLKEKFVTSKGGDYRTVSISWANIGTDIHLIEQQELLLSVHHHFMFTCLDGREILLRTSEYGYEFESWFDGGDIKSSLSYSSETGLRFVIK